MTSKMVRDIISEAESKLMRIAGEADKRNAAVAKKAKSRKL